MNLSNLKPAEGSIKHSKRVGRGAGSGKGGTATRGNKGAKARSGYHQKVGFEGGQMPLYRRVPKFGFKNLNRVEYVGINIDTINANSVVGTVYLVIAGVIENITVDLIALPQGTDLSQY